MTVKWARDTKASGYQIRYAKNSAFKNYKTVTWTGTAATAAKTIGGLSSGSTYYVKIRSYKSVNGVKSYSAWSVKKSITVK